MDAKAHLQKLGWRGSGYSLDHANRGLAKPLLITHKSDNHGLGSKKQKEKQADQWWLNAFDSALKDLGSGKSSALEQAREHGIARGGLYGFFVKGETLEPTFADFSTATATPDASPSPSPSVDTMESVVDGNGKSANGADVSLKRKRADGKARSGGKEKPVERSGSKSDKRGKIQREKAKREAKRGIKSGLRKEAVSEPYFEKSRGMEDEDALRYETVKEVRIAKRRAASQVQEAENKEREREMEKQPKAKRVRRGAAADNSTAVDDSNGRAVEGISKTTAGISNRDSRASGAIPGKPLSEKKKAKYAKRAAEKGISIEEYIKKRKGDRQTGHRGK